MAPAAESVTKLDVLLVRDEPIKCSSSTSTSSMGSPVSVCLKLLVNDRLVGPIPSETMKMRFLLPVGFPFFHPPPDGVGLDVCC